MLSIFSCAYRPSVCLLWRNAYLDLLPIFWWWYLGFWYWIVWAALHILEVNPLSVTSFGNIFSHSVHCLFVLFMVSITVQKLLSLIRFHLFFFFTSITLEDIAKKTVLWLISMSVLFSSRSFIASSLTFRSLIHFLIYFCVWC